MKIEIEIDIENDIFWAVLLTKATVEVYHVFLRGSSLEDLHSSPKN